MSHDLESVHGTASFVSARQDAWHRLGTVLDHNFTAAEALEHAHLGGWNVRKTPLTTITEDGVLEVPERFATVRTNPETGRVDVLGVVGNQYTPIQNEEHTGLLDALVGESGAHFETAGSLKGGRETFVTLKLPTTLTYHGESGVDFYLAGLNSHDGTSAFRFIVTPIRVVCANTQRVAIARARDSFSIRHTSGARAAINEAREALNLTYAYVTAFEEEAKALIEQSQTRNELRTFTDDLFRVNERAITDRVRESRVLHARSVITLAETSPTIVGIQGTRWGAYQAVTEYVDHIMPVRGAQNQADARALRTLTSSVATGLKERAFALVSA